MHIALGPTRTIVNLLTNPQEACPSSPLLSGHASTWSATSPALCLLDLSSFKAVLDANFMVLLNMSIVSLHAGSFPAPKHEKVNGRRGEKSRCETGHDASTWFGKGTNDEKHFK